LVQAETLETIDLPEVDPIAPTQIRRRQESGAGKIGRFGVIQEIGSGGIGTVYLGFYDLLDRRVAIKVAKSGMMDDNHVRRFQSEARAAAQLRHPHIVPVYEYGESDGTRFIAYQFIEGETLRGVLKEKRKLPPEAAVAFTCKIASALHYAHTCGIVHRDVKPGIFWSTDRENRTWPTSVVLGATTTT